MMEKINQRIENWKTKKTEKVNNKIHSHILLFNIG